MTKRAVLACVICLSAVSFNSGVTPLNAQTPVSFSKDILADTGAKVFKLSRPVDAEFQAELEHSRRRAAGWRAWVRRCSGTRRG